MKKQHDLPQEHDELCLGLSQTESERLRAALCELAAITGPQILKARLMAMPERPVLKWRIVPVVALASCALMALIIWGRPYSYLSTTKMGAQEYEELLLSYTGELISDKYLDDELLTIAEVL
ncbi:MAG: hypothetical protein KDD42_07130 [Bdellovibrionales bacterium]|nr:hypothetical protein [Bdellovibrionales bacterium]